MSKLNVTQAFKTVANTLSKHGPEILTGIGIAGMITTTVMAVKATPKAVKLIEQKKEEEQKETLTTMETVKAAWKPYAPAAVTGVCSVVCLISGTAVGVRRNAAIATAYQLSTTALTEYKNKVVDLVDPEKVKEIDTKIAEDRASKKLNDNPVSRSNVIISGDTKLKCCDGIYGGEITASPIDIEKALIDLNWKLLTEDYASLNDFYDLLGVKHIDVGYDVGWNVRKTRRLEVSYDSSLDVNNVPCLVFRYNNPPERGYECIW